MAKDLACHGIRVNTVCPGMVQTALNRSVWQAWYDQAAEADRLSYEEWTDRKIRALVPLGRWQSPEDMGIYFGTRSGKLYVSRDAGRSWKHVLNGLPQIVCVASTVVAELAGPSAPRPARKRSQASAGKRRARVTRREGGRATARKRKRR
jgi:hypothetical protein